MQRARPRSAPHSKALLVRHAWREPRRVAFVGLAVAGLVLGLVAPALTAITPTSTALTIANSIAASSGIVTGASFLEVPPNETPNGVSTTALGEFPVDGSDYGILTSGKASSVEFPGTQASTDDGGTNQRGDTDYDVSILQIDLTIPTGANCLSFNFKFFSEEYPTYVGSPFNDAFIAELDTSDWSTSGSAITAPHNFAFDSSHDVVSINSTGLGGMTPANGAGTAFDGTTSNPDGDTDGGGTVLLAAATPVTAGAHSLYLSIFDQSDSVLDSAVFLDNLRVGSVPNPTADCTPGATEPARLTLTKTVDNSAGGTASKTDWTLSATGPTTISGSTGSAEVTDVSVSPGTYTLDESGPTGYSPSAWICTGGTLTGSSLDLAAGDTASCSITNTAQAPGTAELSASMTDSPDPVSPSAPVRYTIDVSNVGGDPATATTLSGHLPPGTQFLGSDQGCTADVDGNLDCTLGTIASDGTVITNIDLRAPSTPGEYPFQMVASSPDDTSGNAVADQLTTVSDRTADPDDGSGFATGTGSTTVQTPPVGTQFSILTVPAGVTGPVEMHEFTDLSCDLPSPATCIGQTLELTAPSATAAKPLVLKILVAKSAVPVRLSARNAVLYHTPDVGDQTLVPSCGKMTKATANPDPCLSSVKGVKIGGVAYWQYLVYTSSNGSWRPGIIPR